MLGNFSREFQINLPQKFPRNFTKELTKNFIANGQRIDKEITKAFPEDFCKSIPKKVADKNFIGVFGKKNLKKYQRYKE